MMAKKILQMELKSLINSTSEKYPGLFRQVVFYNMSQKRQSQRDVLKRVMEER